MPVEKPTRELTPMDLRLFEPDVLGAFAMVAYGRDAPDRDAIGREARSFRRDRRRRGETA